MREASSEFRLIEAEGEITFGHPAHGSRSNPYCGGTAPMGRISAGTSFLTPTRRRVFDRVRRRLATKQPVHGGTG